MIFLTSSGNSTSKKRILYPQMIRCFSVCWCNHLGHLYWTSSYWKLYSWAMCGRKSINWGDKKFFKNQNFTGLCVCFINDNIIMRSKRSYKWPDATEKMFIVSVSDGSEPPENELVIEFQMPELLSSSSDNKSARSFPFFFVTRNFTTCDLNELIMTRVPSGLWIVFDPSALQI